MPRDPKEYDATIYFLYEGEEGWTCRGTSLKEAEHEIRYWLGKSPGIHEIEEILVVPNSERQNWIWVRYKMRDEEFEREKQLREEREKQEYVRLKAKFG